MTIMFIRAFKRISILLVLLVIKVDAQSCPAISNVAQACVSGSYTGARVLLDMSTFTEEVADCTCAFITDSSVLKIVTYNAPNYQYCNSAIRLSSSSGNSVRFQCLMSGTYLDTSVHNSGDINFETYAQAYDSNYCLVLEHTGVPEANITISCSGPVVSSFQPAEYTESSTGNEITTPGLGDSTYLNTEPLTSKLFASNPQSTYVPSTVSPFNAPTGESITTILSKAEPGTSETGTTTNGQSLESTVDVTTTPDSTHNKPDSATVKASSAKSGVLLTKSDIATERKNVSRPSILHMPIQSANYADTPYSTTTLATAAESTVSNEPTHPAAFSTPANAETDTSAVLSTSMPSTTTEEITSAAPIATEAVAESSTFAAVLSTLVPSTIVETMSITPKLVSELSTEGEVSSTSVPFTTVETNSSTAPIPSEAAADPDNPGSLANATTSIRITTTQETITTLPETETFTEASENSTNNTTISENTETPFTSPSAVKKASIISIVSATKTPETTASEVNNSTAAITISSTQTTKEAATTNTITPTSQHDIESNGNVETTTDATSSSTNVETNPSTLVDITNATVLSETETTNSTTIPIQTTAETATVATLNLTSYEFGASELATDIQPGQENRKAGNAVSNGTLPIVSATTNRTETDDVMTDIITGTVLLHGGDKPAQRYEHIDPALAKMYEDTTNISANMFLPPETREALGQGVKAERIGSIQADKVGEITTTDTFGINNRLQDVTTRSFWMEPGSSVADTNTNSLTDSGPMGDTSTNIYGLTDAAPSLGPTNTFGISETPTGINRNVIVSEGYSQSTTTDLNQPANYGIETATQVSLQGTFGSSAVTNNFQNAGDFGKEKSTTMYRTTSASWISNSAVNAGDRNDVTSNTNAWDTNSNAYTEGSTNAYPMNTQYGATRDYSSSDSYSFWLTENNNSTGAPGSDTTTDMPRNSHDFIGTTIVSESTNTVNDNNSDVYGVNESANATYEYANENNTNGASFESNFQPNMTNHVDKVKNYTNDVVISKVEQMATTQVPGISRNSDIISTTDSYSSSGTHNINVDSRPSDSVIDASFQTVKTTSNYNSVDSYNQPDLTNQYDYFPNDANKNKIESTATQGSTQTSTYSRPNDGSDLFSHTNNTSSDTNNTEIQVSTERQYTADNPLTTESTPSAFVATGNYSQPDIRNQYDFTENGTTDIMSVSLQHGFKPDQMVNISSEQPAKTTVSPESLNNDRTNGSTVQPLEINPEPVTPATDRYNYIENTNMIDTRTASHDYTSDKTTVIANTDSTSNGNAIPTITPKTPEVVNEMVRPDMAIEPYIVDFDNTVSSVITTGNETEYSVSDPYTFETLGVIPTDGPTTSANNEIPNSQSQTDNYESSNIQSVTTNTPQWSHQNDERVTAHSAIPTINDTVESTNTSNNAEYSQTGMDNMYASLPSAATAIEVTNNETLPRDAASDMNMTAPEEQFSATSPVFNDSSVLSGSTVDTPQRGYEWGSSTSEAPIVSSTVGVSSYTVGSRVYPPVDTNLDMGYGADAPNFVEPSTDMTPDTSSRLSDVLYRTEAPVFAETRLPVDTRAHTQQYGSEWVSSVPESTLLPFDTGVDSSVINSGTYTSVVDKTSIPSTRPDVQYPTDAPYSVDPRADMSLDINSTRPDVQYSTDAPFYVDPRVDLSSGVNVTRSDVQYPTDVPFYFDPRVDPSSDANATQSDVQYPTDAPFYFDPRADMSSDTNATRSGVQYPTDAPYFTDPSVNMTSDTNSTRPDIQYPTDAPFYVDPIVDMSPRANTTRPDVLYPTDTPVYAETNLPVDTSASTQQYMSEWISSVPETTTSSSDTRIAGSSMNSDVSHSLQSTTNTATNGAATDSFTDTTYVDSVSVMSSTRPWGDSNWEATKKIDQSTTPNSKDQPLWTSTPSVVKSVNSFDIQTTYSSIQTDKAEISLTAESNYTNENETSPNNTTYDPYSFDKATTEKSTDTPTTVTYSYNRDVASTSTETASPTDYPGYPSYHGEMANADSDAPTDVYQGHSNDMFMNIYSNQNADHEILGNDTIININITVPPASGEEIIATPGPNYSYGHNIAFNPSENATANEIFGVSSQTDAAIDMSSTKKITVEGSNGSDSYIDANNMSKPLLGVSSIEYHVNDTITNNQEQMLGVQYGDTTVPDVHQNTFSYANDVSTKADGIAYPDNTVGPLSVTTDRETTTAKTENIATTITAYNTGLNSDAYNSVIDNVNKYNYNSFQSDMSETATPLSHNSVDENSNMYNYNSFHPASKEVVTDSYVDNKPVVDIKTSISTTDGNVNMETTTYTAQPAAVATADVNVASSTGSLLSETTTAIPVDEFPLSHSEGIRGEIMVEKRPSSKASPAISSPATDPFDRMHDQGRTNSFINNDLTSTESQLVSKTVVKLENTLEGTLPTTDVDIFPATMAMPEDTGVTKNETETPAAVPTAPEHVSDGHMEEIPVTETMIAIKVKSVEVGLAEAGKSLTDTNNPTTLPDSEDVSVKSDVTKSGTVSSSTSDSAPTTTGARVTTTRTMTTSAPKQTTTPIHTTTTRLNDATTTSETLIKTSAKTTTSDTTTTEVPATERIMPEIIAKDTINKLEVPAVPPPIKIQPTTRDSRPMLGSRPPVVEAVPATRRPFAPHIPEVSTEGTVVDGVTPKVTTTQKGDINVHFGDDTFQAGFFDMDNKTYILVVAAIAGLVLLAIVLGIVIHHSRRHRSEKVDISGEGGLQPISHRNLAYEHMDPEKGNGFPNEPSGNGTAPEANGNNVTAANGYKGSIEA